MPLYEYLCKECGNTFDKLRSIKEADEPAECSHCHSLQTRRMLSLFFANSSGHSIAGSSSSGCAGCSGGTCANCGH